MGIEANLTRLLFICEENNRMLKTLLIKMGPPAFDEDFMDDFIVEEEEDEVDEVSQKMVVALPDQLNNNKGHKSQEVTVEKIKLNKDGWMDKPQRDQTMVDKDHKSQAMADKGPRSQEAMVDIIRLNKETRMDKLRKNQAKANIDQTMVVDKPLKNNDHKRPQSQGHENQAMVDIIRLNKEAKTGMFKENQDKNKDKTNMNRDKLDRTVDKGQVNTKSKAKMSPIKTDKLKVKQVNWDIINQLRKRQTNKADMIKESMTDQVSKKENGMVSGANSFGTVTNSVRSTNQDPISKTTKKRICPTCGKPTFHLKRHVDTVHLKLRPYPCRDCGKTFGDKFNRKRHEAASHKEDDLRGGQGQVHEAAAEDVVLGGQTDAKPESADDVTL